MPPRTNVRFQGLDWAVEEAKSQRGSERRKEARQRRLQKRKQKSIKKQQLESFLRFVLYADNETAQKILDLRQCLCLLCVAKIEGFVIEKEGLSIKDNVGALYDNFELLMKNRSLSFLVGYWMDAAVEQKFYSKPDEYFDIPKSNEEDQNLMAGSSNKMVSTVGSPKTKACNFKIPNSATTDNEKVCGNHIQPKNDSKAPGRKPGTVSVEVPQQQVKDFRSFIDLFNKKSRQSFLQYLNRDDCERSGVINEIISKFEGMYINETNNLKEILSNFRKKKDVAKQIEFLKSMFADRIDNTVVSSTIASQS